MHKLLNQKTHKLCSQSLHIISISAKNCPVCEYAPDIGDCKLEEKTPKEKAPKVVSKKQIQRRGDNNNLYAEYSMYKMCECAMTKGRFLKAPKDVKAGQMLYCLYEKEKNRVILSVINRSGYLPRKVLANRTINLHSVFKRGNLHIVPIVKSVERKDKDIIINL